MKKLSELSDNTLLGIGDEDFSCIVKEEFVETMLHAEAEICIVEPIYASFDLWDFLVITTDSYDMDEGWADTVMYAIKSDPELKNMEKKINEIFKKIPSYELGEMIENDMVEVRP